MTKVNAYPIGDLGDRPESAGVGSRPGLWQEVHASDKARLASQVSGIQYNYFDETGAQPEPAMSIAPPLGQRDDRLPLRGREGLLAILADSGAAKRVRVLHGMGGCGKTRLAIELAWQAEQRGLEVWWVSAIDKARLVAGMRAVGHRLDISDDELRRGDVADVIWQSLTSRKKEWLLVIDAADDPQILAAPGAPVGHGTGWLRPLSSSAGSVVVTSRDGRAENWGSWCAFHLVGMLATSEAALVLTDHTSGNAELGSEDDALELARRLGGLPLALKIAGSFLAESVAVPAAFSTTDLFRTYNAYRQAIEYGQLDSAFPVPATGSTELTDELARGLIGRTWELTLDSLQARQMPEARRVLRLLASLADAPIPHLLLLKPDILSHCPFFEGITGHRLWHVLKTLAGFGLIDLTADDDTLSVTRLHPLVRDTSHLRAEAELDESNAYLMLAAKLVRQAAEDAGSPEDPATWQTWQLLSPHAIYILESVNSAGGGPVDGSTLVAYSAGMVARYQAEQGLYGTAETVHRAVLAIQLQILGADHQDTLATRHEIAGMRAMQGDQASAEAEFRDVLAAQVRVLGADHRDTLATQQNVALVMAERGDHAGAEAEYRDVLAAQVRVLGADHPNTLVTRHSIAYVMTVQGDYAGAEAQYRDVLAAEVRVLGADHPETLATRHEIARMRAMQGDHAGAETQYREVLAAKLAVRGADHPSTLTTRDCIANVMAAQGDHVTAEVEYRQVLAARERVLGADHPDTRTARYWLAVELAALGRHAEAEAEYRQVLADLQGSLGAEHREALTTWYQVAGELAAQGRHAEAEAEYRQVLAARERVLGAEDHDTCETRRDLASALLELGRQLIYPSMYQSRTTRGGDVMTDHDTKSGIEQALAHFKEALSLIDPDEDPGYYGVILHDIAVTNQAMGNLPEAAEAYQQAVIYKRKRLPDSPADLATTMEVYCDFLVECGDLAEARIILAQLKDLLPQVQEPERRAVHLHTMGKGFESLGARGQEDAYTEALAAYKEALPLINPDADPGSSATVLNDIGDIYQLQGKLEEACTAYKQAVDYMRLVPEKKKTLAYMLVDLGRIERRLGNLNRTTAEEGDAED